ncbi:hypothetical protein DdX_17866 [Ditylenchus destructor]|uniref:Uncharacterized protein n=1 Tax=Ditylenchus destructor TaxID=166010 RepID=A0AAD4MND2_9BILA|nr:hypothetical protein DdX_17866 [Ditylenchus destructor]
MENCASGEVVLKMEHGQNFNWHSILEHMQKNASSKVQVTLDNPMDLTDVVEEIERYKNKENTGLAQVREVGDVPRAKLLIRSCQKIFQLMRIPTVILLLSATFITVHSRFLPSNEVRVQRSLEVINDEEYTNGQLIYNKSSVLVRKKREMTALSIAVLSAVLSYGCYIAVDATPIKPYVNYLLKYWGFREGHEGLFWKSLATVVNTNVNLDANGMIHPKRGISGFMNAPAELTSKIQEFREEAAGIIAKKLSDEAEAEARMRKERQQRKAMGIDEPVLSEYVKAPEDLNQMSKAIMADSMIDTLIGINNMGKTTWKYNPNNKEHRTLYEGMLKAKAAIEAKYKNKCELKEMTAAQLPAYKSLVVRMLGAIPIWPRSLFKKINNVPVEEHKVVQKVTDAEAKVIDRELAEKLREIQELYQLLPTFSPTLEQLAEKEEEEESAGKGREKAEPGKIRSLLDIGPPGTLEAGKVEPGKAGIQGSAAGKLPVLAPAQGQPQNGESNGTDKRHPNTWDDLQRTVYDEDEGTDDYVILAGPGYDNKNALSPAIVELKRDTLCFVELSPRVKIFEVSYFWIPRKTDLKRQNSLCPNRSSGP